jgi:hypothetical protein
MQVIGIILILISVGTVVGPVAAVAIIYRDDLSQLVITPQIRDIINGNSPIIPVNNNANNGKGGGSSLSGLMSPTLVSAQIDEAAHTFTGIFKITNALNYDLTLNSFSANVEITQNHIQASSLSLGNPVTVPAGETSQLAISGSWTQAAQDYIINNYSSTASVEVFIVGAEVNVNGVVIQSSGTIDAGNIPFNVVG